MRIIAGKYRSRKIHSAVPDSNCNQLNKSGFRPTSDRARESLFNTLNNRIDFTDMKCLDLFAGTGSFGFECLSRGAARCVFVDISRKSSGIIEKTAEELGCKDNIEFISGDCLTFLKRDSEYFDLIFADPPYNYEHYSEITQGILKRDFIASIIEYGQPDSLNAIQVNEGTEVVDKKIGVTNFKIFIK